MNGRLFYFSIAALLGILSSTERWQWYFLLFLLFIFCLYSFKNFSNVFFLLIVAFFSIYLFTANLLDQQRISKFSGHESSFSVRIDDGISFDGDRLKAVAYHIQNKEKIYLSYKMKTKEEKLVLQKTLLIGAICKIEADLKKPTSFNNPNSFQYKIYLERKRIYWIADIKSLEIVPQKPSLAHPLLELRRVRDKEIKMIEENSPPSIAPITAAMIFGERSLIHQDILNAYQKIGVIHLLAISGLHVSLLAAMIYYLGIRVGFMRESMKKFLYIILPIYSVLAGATPSVNRSVLMMICIMFFSKRKFSFKVGAIDGLSFSFLLLTLMDPLVVYDVGFQLSFSVSLGLVLSAPVILKKASDKLALLLTTSYIAQLCSIPFILFFFFKTSILGVVVNLIYIPLFSFVFMPSVFFLYFLRKLFGYMPMSIEKVLSLFISISNKLAIKLSTLQYFEVITGRLGSFLTIVIILLIIFVHVYWERHSFDKKLWVIIFLPWIFVIFLPFASHFHPEGEVTILDVGQGDCIFIRLPNNHGTYLIDTGGVLKFEQEEWRRRSKEFEIGRDVVVKFLNGKGVSTIDKLILTHGDMDHVGGAVGVLNGIKVKEILIPSVKETSETVKEVAKLAKQKQIQIVKVSKGDYWKSGPYSFEILNPKENFDGESNSGSIVILANMGEMNWLFTGDLDSLGEERLMKSYPSLKVDVLKVGHHGSKYSSEDIFIQQIKPQWALISAGKGNRFGHPHREVLDKLQAIGSRVLRTDENGAITYRFSNEGGTFSVYVP
ncbi:MULTISPECIES: DNA internalization-related competence protein ComEC/Rec2 [unclassified Bacillus (in: firmicutes)]|uniref:DNA internalization-related competence protein ComEC/Rec2 n=1 Tax=unclassified Bacillus (in: firmicutes) TaxID=185979 RepID=UPI0008DFE601|nr:MULTISPECIES: DNA internalization-related competence protein ComEC/Rec2 [unclassified Bacillus (in: firmicutes)]SFA95386.1 competence protein ComEC [Bacillus sp. UNCCL13]SFQ79074.1 competence protein ComEC [Bacillus sp. cl95]